MLFYTVGLSFFKWCCGSQPNHCNLLPFTKTTHTETSISDVENLPQGEQMFVTVKVNCDIAILYTHTVN